MTPHKRHATCLRAPGGWPFCIANNSPPSVARPISADRMLCISHVIANTTTCREQPTCPSAIRRPVAINYAINPPRNVTKYFPEVSRVHHKVTGSVLSRLKCFPNFSQKIILRQKSGISSIRGILKNDTNACNRRGRLRRGRDKLRLSLL